jgi:hypothetical protein
LSTAYKKSLTNESIKSSREYKRFREIKGLRWEKSCIKEVSFDSQGNAIVVATADYEQQILGEHVVIGKVDLIAMVIWKVADLFWIRSHCPKSTRR